MWDSWPNQTLTDGSTSKKEYWSSPRSLFLESLLIVRIFFPVIHMDILHPSRMSRHIGDSVELAKNRIDLWTYFVPLITCTSWRKSTTPSKLIELSRDVSYPTPAEHQCMVLRLVPCHLPLLGHSANDRSTSEAGLIVFVTACTMLATCLPDLKTSAPGKSAPSSTRRTHTERSPTPYAPVSKLALACMSAGRGPIPPQLAHFPSCIASPAGFLFDFFCWWSGRKKTTAGFL